jgi:predicted dehydrogenase
MAEAFSAGRLGLTGLGGYAGYVCDRILAEADAGEAAAQLLAVCEPEPDRFARRVEDLRTRGIPVVRDFEKLLNFTIDGVWLPLPIDLHLPYTEQALRAGKAVICEKPAAGCVDDVDDMIAARDRARLPVAIGFQDVFQPAVSALKRRLVAGEFGKPLAAQVIGCWPRSERYFTRNDWAGRMRRDGRWVMDSPASNAMAHFLHLALFLLGRSEHSSGSPTEVVAELYRANPIENYDTCSMCFTVGGDVPVCVAYTHACATALEPVVTIETERGQIRYVSGRHIEVRFGTNVEILRLASNPHKLLLESFRAAIRGTDGAAVASTLEMARAHTVAVNAASEAAAVVDVARDYVQVLPSADQSSVRAIREIVPALKKCVADKCLLHDTGAAPWSQRGGRMAINGYAHFAGPATPAATPASVALGARTTSAAAAAPAALTSVAAAAPVTT